jgi:hypothetical protein
MTIGVRKFNDEAERLDVTLAALRGVPIAARPEFWQTYNLSREDVLKEAQPISVLLSKFALREEKISTVVRGLPSNAADIVYLPLVDGSSFWTVILDGSNAEILGFIPLDPFD